MKIGLMIYGSLNTLSGGYLYDRKLVEYLVSQGDEVEVISQTWGSYVERLGQNLEEKWQRRLAALDVDVLLQDELNHPSLFEVNSVVKPQISYPILAITHHLRGSENHPGPAMWLYCHVEKRYLQGVDGFIWNSHTTRQVVESVIGKKAPGIVAYPAGDRLGGLDEPQITLRSQESGPLRIVFVGNLIPRKGLHKLLTALRSLRSQEWGLTVVGRPDVDPVYSRKLRIQAEESRLAGHVQFLGNLPEPELANELQSAHLLAMVSEYEGFGIVYLEGMSYGLPAIASTAGAACEIIQDGVNGRLVRPGDTAALASAIRPYLEDRSYLQMQSLAARKRFLEFPTWEQSAATVRQFLVDTLEARKGSTS